MRAEAALDDIEAGDDENLELTLAAGALGDAPEPVLGRDAQLHLGRVLADGRLPHESHRGLIHELLIALLGGDVLEPQLVLVHGVHVEALGAPPPPLGAPGPVGLVVVLLRLLRVKCRQLLWPRRPPLARLLLLFNHPLGLLCANRPPALDEARRVAVARAAVRHLPHLTVDALALGAHREGVGLLLRRALHLDVLTRPPRLALLRRRLLLGELLLHNRAQPPLDEEHLGIGAGRPLAGGHHDPPLLARRPVEGCAQQRRLRLVLRLVNTRTHQPHHPRLAPSAALAAAARRRR